MDTAMEREQMAGLPAFPFSSNLIGVILAG